VHRVPLIAKPELLEPLMQEEDELIRIFRQRIITARKRSNGGHLT
jgi:hypothetical protein